MICWGIVSEVLGDFNLLYVKVWLRVLGVLRDFKNSSQFLMICLGDFKECFNNLKPVPDYMWRFLILGVSGYFKEFFLSIWIWRLLLMRFSGILWGVKRSSWLIVVLRDDSLNFKNFRRKATLSSYMPKKPDTPVSEWITNKQDYRRACQKNGQPI